MERKSGERTENGCHLEQKTEAIRNERTAKKSAEKRHEKVGLLKAAAGGVEGEQYIAVVVQRSDQLERERKRSERK